MSAITTIPAPPRGDRRQVFRVGWDVYKAMCEGREERSPVRLAYDGKDLEIMTKGSCHEDSQVLFGRLMSALRFELDIQCLKAGETTWNRFAISI